MYVELDEAEEATYILTNHRIQKHKLSFIVLLISISVAVYLFAFILPYADRKGFFSENDVPNKIEATKYLFLCLTMLVGYSVVLSKYLQRITCIRFLNYPLAIFNVYSGFWLTLIYKGGTILWFMMPTIILLVIALPYGFYKGLLKDIQSRK